MNVIASPVRGLPRLARAGFAALPTPLQELKNLSDLLGPRIFVKRDDLTGLGLGGNKVRKLDFLMPALLDEGYDTIVTGAFFQSNWCTAVSAAGRKTGMKVVLVKRAPPGYAPDRLEGNHLLHVLLGSEIVTAPPETDLSTKEQAVERLRQEGLKPVLVGVGGNTPHGVAGYVDAMRELAEQAEAMGVRPDYVVHASGSGGTQAGSVIGARLHLPRTRVVCSSTGSRNRATGGDLVLKLIGETVRRFGLDVEIGPQDIEIHDQYAGGYGYVRPAKLEAVRLLAETEGLILDPVYTASAMACLIDRCRQGDFKKGDTIVFVNTGGQAGLFPYEAPLHAYMEGRELPWTVPPWHPPSWA
jgi:1-aminocyclopropane-1-carboxylate deaminase/D-cysteine desulfhydrase-like pyridoxal-dependent ACC family enzyme